MEGGRPPVGEPRNTATLAQHHAKQRKIEHRFFLLWGRFAGVCASIEPWLEPMLHDHNTINEIGGDSVHAAVVGGDSTGTFQVRSRRLLDWGLISRGEVNFRKPVRFSRSQGEVDFGPCLLVIKRGANCKPGESSGGGLFSANESRITQ